MTFIERPRRERSPEDPSYGAALIDGNLYFTPKSIIERNKLKDLSDEESQMDRLTGLPFETEKMEHRIILALANAVTSGRNWACIHLDLDQLKRINELSEEAQGDREWGDAFIIWGISRLMEHLHNSPFTGFPTYIYRPTQVADEAVVWIFSNTITRDITPVQLDYLKYISDEIDRDTLTSVTNPNLIFSVTCGLVTSLDTTIANKLPRGQKQSREFIKDLKIQVEKRAKIDIRHKKLEKDVSGKQLVKLLGLPTTDWSITDAAERWGAGRIESQKLILISRTLALSTVLRMVKLVPSEDQEKLAELVGLDLARIEEIIKEEDVDPEEINTLFAKLKI